MIGEMKREGVYTLPFWLLCLSTFLFFTSFNMILPELPSYLDSMNAGEYKGLIIASFTLMAGISRPFSGKLSDTIGRVPVMVFGVFVSSVCGLLYPFASNVFLLLLLRFIHGFSTGFKPTGTSAFLADIIPAEKRGEAMGLFSFFSSLGTGVGPALSTPIKETFSIDTLFYTSSAFSCLSILILFGLEETLKDKVRFHWSLLKIKSNEIIEINAIPPALVMILIALGSGAIYTLVPDFSVHLGESNKGMFYVYYTGATVLVRLLLGRASDIYGRVPVMLVATALLALSMSMIATATTATHFYAGAVLFGLGFGLGSPTIIAWTIDVSDDRYKSRALATMYLALEIGVGLGAFGAGWIYQNNINFLTNSFYFAAAANVIAFFYLLFERRRIKKSQPSNSSHIIVSRQKSTSR